ncbi:MAG: metal ABC transporter ATP-binding protein [Acidimicrobiaceae bacterium]|nr:metal ABC transporter ATP-binding protein [Acidimicrobiia bacterium]MCY4494624.1 metal ABC transporter ATP-binding protein [Acidimicrobiaceae bacterium]
MKAADGDDSDLTGPGRSAESARRSADLIGLPTPWADGVTMAVRVENLTVQFNGFNALDGITHTFEPGTSTAVMGINGSGKTTLLETIAGLVRPAFGRIDGVGERLAYVCQHPPTTWMPLTAGEVLAMGRYRERGLIGRFRTGDRAVMHSAAQRLHVDHLLKSSFGELSGGQQQRVRIAQMLASDPQLLLLDEPITGLDIPSQDRILAMIEGCSRRGATVVLTTHHLDEARHCDFVMLLANRLIASGRPEEMFTEERLRQAFGERLLGDHAHHSHAHDMIVLDDHGHQSRAGHDHTDKAPIQGFGRSPRETH